MESVRFADGETSAPLPISQIAIVVNDFEDALAWYRRVLGRGPWDVHEHGLPALHPE
jgi:hypothetical protein